MAGRKPLILVAGALQEVPASDTLAFPAGAVGAPSFYLDGDTSTGFYRIGANNVGFAVAGSKVLDISASGLGIGATLNTWSTGSILQIGSGGSFIFGDGYQNIAGTNAYYNGGWLRHGPTYKPTQFNHADGVFRWYASDAGTADSAITWSQLMTLDAASLAVAVPMSTADITASGIATVNNKIVQTYTDTTSTSGTIYAADFTSSVTLPSATTLNVFALRASTSMNLNGGSATQSSGATFRSVVTGAGTLGLTRGAFVQLLANDAGVSTNITTASIIGLGCSNSSAGTIGTLTGLDIGAPTNTGGGAITTYNAISVAATTAPGTVRGLYMQIAAAAGRYNIYASGSAMNVLGGKTRIGGVTDPTVALDVTGDVALSGDLTLSGATKRITGNFADSISAVSRVAFQTYSANDGSAMTVIPNGTSAQAGWYAYNDSAAANCEYAGVLVNATEMRLVSGIIGTGTYIPMTFYTNGTEAARIDTAGYATFYGGILSDAGYFDMTVPASHPAAPAAGKLRIHARSRAGRYVVEMEDPAGQDSSLQPALFGNNIQQWLPGTGTTVAINYGSSWTARNSGTSAAQAHPNLAATNKLTAMRRATFSTGTTATGSSGIQGSAASFWRGNAAGLGGFFFYARIGIETWGAGTQIFVGLSTLNAALTGEPSAQSHSVIFGCDSTDTSFQVMTHYQNLAEVTKTSCGVAQSSGQIFDITLYCKPNDTKIIARVVEEVSGTVCLDNVELTTNLPINNLFMYPHCQIRSTSGTTAKVLALNKMYIESDF